MTSIEWTDKTWNPVVGCSLVSAGCENCYAMGVAGRRMSAAHKGLTVLRAHGKGQRWTGEVRYLPERLATPLGWRKPRRVFVNSMSDLFQKGVPNEFVAECFGVMAACPQHTFQILTKRPARAAAFFRWIETAPAWGDHDRNDPLAVLACAISKSPTPMPSWVGEEGEAIFKAIEAASWPLPSVLIGASVEDRKHGLPRIDHLRDVPAAIRFLSIEPLLEDLGTIDLSGIGWVIVGGESGAGARPMHPAWVRSIRDQCAAAGVPFFFKQWGGVLKKRTGRELDGRTHDEYPREEVP